MATLTDKNNFSKVCSFVIDKLEGGYYHPDMLKDGRIKDTRYEFSGETMFGIDRLRGGTINETPAGREFWAIIDNAGARYNWKWNYKGGSLGPKLKKLVADMMYPQYDKLASRYLSPKSRKIVESDNRLFFHFVYATWNGSGWFQKFAKKINEAVNSGVTNKNQLVQIALQSRIQSGNSLVKQGGVKISGFIDQVPKSNNAFLFIGVTALILGIAFIYLVKKKIIKI